MIHILQNPPGGSVERRASFFYCVSKTKSDSPNFNQLGQIQPAQV